MSREQPCWLYLIADDRGHCKIGIARYPLRRVGELQVGNPYPIQLHSAWKFASKDTAFCIEQVALYATRRHALRGEWRHCNPMHLRSLMVWLVASCARISLAPGHDMRWVRVRDAHAALSSIGRVDVIGRLGQ